MLTASNLASFRKSSPGAEFLASPAPDLDSLYPIGYILSSA